MLYVYRNFMARNKLFTNYKLYLYAFLTNDIPFWSQVVEASLAGTSFFGTRLMAGFGELSTEPSLLLLMVGGFGPGDNCFHLNGSHSLSGMH